MRWKGVKGLAEEFFSELISQDLGAEASLSLCAAAGDRCCHIYMYILYSYICIFIYLLIYVYISIDR